MQTGLEGKPWYFGFALGLLVGAVGLGAGHQMKLGPMKQRIKAQERKLRDLEGQIQRGESARARLPEFQERVQRLELDLEKLLEILPERRNVADLLRQVRALAERTDFDLVNFTPGREAEQEFYSEWPISLNVSGTYHNLARFFDRMSRFHRIINVDNLTIRSTPRPSPTQTIEASFVAKTFVYKDQYAEGAGP
jgi:Tfp pilus assembly protein PilO